MNGGEHARAEGIEGEREVDLTGEAQRPRGRAGGEWERGPRRRGALATLSSPASVPARWSGGSAPLFRPGRGNREGGEGGEVGWAGVGGAGVRGCGPVWAGGSSGGEAPSPFVSFFLSDLFSVFFLFIYFLFCFSSFKSI